MYHLRNKAYVEIESRITRTQPYLSISPQIGYEHVPGTYEEPAEQLGYATSLDALEPEAFTEMFNKAFTSTEKVFIYADGKTYLRLYAMAVKALLPSVTLDVFRWIFLCKKATFNVSLLNIHKPATNILAEMTIDEKLVVELFKANEPLQAAMTTLMCAAPDQLSLEWRVLRLFTCDRVGKLPKTLRNILRRIALANTHDALDVWGRMIADPGMWDFAGCDMNTLLNGQSVFEGTLNFQYLNNPMFLQPGVFENEPSRDWVLGLLKELIQVLDFCDEGPTAGRTRLIYQLMTSDTNVYEVDALKERVITMFRGNKRLALPNADSGKYDENLIRYVLHEDVEKLRTCVVGAQW